MKSTTFKNIEYIVSNQNKYTYKIKAIKDFVEDNIQGEVVLNIFAGESKYGTTNDLDPNQDTDYSMEAIEFLKMYDECSVDTILFDPPFNLDLHKKLYSNGLTYKTYGKWIWDIKKEIARVLKVGGKVISSGYETNGIGSLKGFEKEKLLVVAHGGLLRDTFTYSEVKIESGKHYNTWRGGENE